MMLPTMVFSTVLSAFKVARMLKLSWDGSFFNDLVVIAFRCDETGIQNAAV